MLCRDRLLCWRWIAFSREGAKPGIGQAGPITYQGREARVDKSNEMKILAWNIRHGGGARVPRILAALERHRPDIVVLTEYRHNPGGEAISAGLDAMGLTFQAAGDRKSVV